MHGSRVNDNRPDSSVLRPIGAALALIAATIWNVLPPTHTAARTNQAHAAPLTSRVHTHVASEQGILANAYLVETGAGVVAIDATLTVSDASALRERLDALQQPLLAVLITHGHPDHYNGVTQLVAGTQVPIVATVGVDRVLREWDAAKEQQWKPTFGDEWPADRTFPTQTVRDGESLAFGDVRFTAHDLGPGESHHDAYWLADDGTTRVAFVGDLVFNGVHSYVSDGHTGRWLENLEAAPDAFAEVDRLYPGHGPDGGLEMLGQQRRYLERYREAIRTLADGRASLTDAEKAALTEVMVDFLPAGRLTFLISNGADAVAAELAEGRATSVSQRNLVAGPSETPRPPPPQ